MNKRAWRVWRLRDEKIQQRRYDRTIGRNRMIGERDLIGGKEGYWRNGLYGVKRERE